MNFDLYVGNYPFDYSREDLAEVFQDFDGIQIDKFLKNERKSFSFLRCKDIDQAVSVIRQKNNVFVSGRKLIVRAKDEKLQEYVQLILRNDTGDDTAVSQKSFYGANETRRRKTNHDGNEEKYRHVKSVDSPFLVPLQVLRNPKTPRKASEKNHWEEIERKSCHSSSSSVQSHSHEYIHAESSGCETSERSSKSNNYSLERHDEDDSEDSEFTWLSVTNFPLWTRKASIYELFSDFEPLHVEMICNKPRADRVLTEAHVCFLNREVADDVIMSFDNTMFGGRLLLVNDIQDLTVMNELLDVNKVFSDTKNIVKRKQ